MARHVKLKCTRQHTRPSGWPLNREDHWWGASPFYEGHRTVSGSSSSLHASGIGFWGLFVLLLAGQVHPLIINNGNSVPSPLLPLLPWLYLNSRHVRRGVVNIAHVGMYYAFDCRVRPRNDTGGVRRLARIRIAGGRGGGWGWALHTPVPCYSNHRTITDFDH